MIILLSSNTYLGNATVTERENVSARKINYARIAVSKHRYIQGKPARVSTHVIEGRDQHSVHAP